MAEEQPKMIPTLGLTGVTVNAMALIAPGAFLWITFVLQAGYVFPSGLSMWFGILVALSLAYATAISYAELAKLYPGAGSSYLFAEQAFLGKTHAYRFARIAKFIIGWASHLYYWVYPASDGGDDGRHGRLHRRQRLPQHDQPGHPGTDFHGPDRDHLFLLRRVHRFPGRYRLDRWSISRSTGSRSPRCCSSPPWRSPTASRIPKVQWGWRLDSAGNVVKTVIHYTFTGDSPSHTSALVGRCAASF